MNESCPPPLGSFCVRATGRAATWFPFWSQTVALMLAGPLARFTSATSVEAPFVLSNGKLIEVPIWLCKGTAASVVPLLNTAKPLREPLLSTSAHPSASGTPGKAWLIL